MRKIFYYNRNEQIYNALKMVASIEVKEPNNSWMLDKNVEEYADGLYLELAPNLFKNRKIVLTNIRKWEFFDASNVTDKKLIEQISLYVKILELCRFDDATDCQWVVETDITNGKKSKRKVLKKDIIVSRWNELKKIEILKEKIDTIDEELEKKHFDAIVSLTDEMFMNEIKEYVESACIKTVDVITTKVRLMVNRSFSEKIDGAGICSISDLNYDYLKWSELLEEIRKIVRIYEM